MKRTLFLLVLMMSVAVLIALVGCSDDDKGDDTIYGSNDDPRFAGIFDVANGATEMAVDWFAVNMALTQGYLQTATARSDFGSTALADLDRHVVIEDGMASYNASSGWHVIDFISRVEHSEDTVWFQGLDSLRFTDKGGQYLNNIPDFDSLQQVEYRSTSQMTGTNSPTVYDTSAFVITGDFFSHMTLNGSAYGSLEEAGDATTCGITGSYSQSFTNIPLDSGTVYKDEGCPGSGSLALHISLTPDCEEGAVPDSEAVWGNWTVTMSFSNGQMHFTATDGTTTWTMNDWCGPDPTDLSSSDSVFVAEVLGEQIGSFYYDIPISEGLLNQIVVMSGRQPIGSMNAQQFDSAEVYSLSHGYADGWHTFAFGMYLYSPGVETRVTDLAGVDSIRVYENGNIVEQPSNPDDVTRFDIRLHAQWEELTGNNKSGVIHHRTTYQKVTYQMQTMASGTGTISDTTYRPIIGFEWGCDVELTHNATLSNLIFDPGSGGCPPSGTISSTATIDVSCSNTEDDHYNTNGTWTVTAVGNSNGTVTITFNNGHIHWSVTENCGDRSGKAWSNSLLGDW